MTLENSIVVFLKSIQIENVEAVGFKAKHSFRLSKRKWQSSNPA